MQILLKNHWNRPHRLFLGIILQLLKMIRNGVQIGIKTVIENRMYSFQVRNKRYKQ